MEKCLNCNNKFTGNFCNNCGQKKKMGALTMKMVFSDFVTNVFLFDSRLYKTLLGLIIKPGIIARTYLAGKKEAYLPPFQFFLLFMTIYLIVFNYFGDMVFSFINEELQSSSSSKISKIQIIQALVKNQMDILYFVLTPIIALYVRLFFKKSEYNYPETLIFSLYVVGVSFLLSSITVIGVTFEPKFFLFKLVIIFGYFPYAIVQFTKSFSFAGVIKSLFTILLSYLTFIIIVLITVIIYVSAVLN
jgi:hypothetical protein